MRVTPWLVGEEMLTERVWSIVVHGNMDALIVALQDYPSDLTLHCGHDCGFVHFDNAFPDVSTAADQLWQKIESLVDGKMLTRMSGQHNASYVTIERGSK